MLFSLCKATKLHRVGFSTVIIFFIVTDSSAGMLTFIMYYLLKNPEAMLKLRKEVDTLIGSRAMTIDDVNKLPYLLGE